MSAATGEQVPRPTRRTQAERRTATRAALLEATIDGLVEHGYASLTTAQIAEAAGVTRGALAHHFASKSEVVVEAVRHLGEQLGQEFMAKAAAMPDATEDRPRDLLNLVWEIYSGREFVAVLDLLAAARTDSELREALRTFEAEGLAVVTGAARAVYGEVADLPGFQGLMTTTTSTLRGLALLSSVRDVDRDWRAARRHLGRLWEDFLAQA